MTRVVTVIVLSSFAVGAGAAQTCDTIFGGTRCGSHPLSSGRDSAMPSRYESGARSGSDPLTPFTGVQSLGTELVGLSRPATIGAITFSGGGTRCGGLFRSGSC